MRKKVTIFLIITIIIISLVSVALLLFKSNPVDNVTDENIIEVFNDKGIVCEINEFPPWVSETFPDNCEKRILIIDGNNDYYYDVSILRFDNEQEVKETIKKFSFNNSDIIFYKNNIILVYSGEDNKVIDVLKNNFIELKK